MLKDKNYDNKKRILIIILSAIVILEIMIIVYNCRSNKVISLNIKTQTISPTENQSTSITKLIDINSAGMEELKSLPGIGEVIAGRIIDYRNTNGKFTSKSQIKDVKGIGNKIYSDIEKLICVK